MNAREPMKILEVAPNVEAMHFSVEEFAMYRLDFEARGSGRHLWFVDFFDAAGEKNYADNYSSLVATDAWTPVRCYFMARARAVEAVAGFRRGETPLQVRAVQVTPATKAETRARMSEQLQRLPPISAPVADADYSRLPRLRAIPAEKGPIRWVALGDSLSNDLVNGLGHLWIEEACPDVTVTPIHANGPEKLCSNYQADEALRRLVFTHRPDILTIGGVSHVGMTEAIRAIVAKTRAACGADVDVLYIDVDVRELSAADRLERREWLAEMESWGERERFAVFDLGSVFDDYVRQTGRPRSEFMRDAVHANDPGKYILGRMLAGYWLRCANTPRRKQFQTDMNGGIF